MILGKASTNNTELCRCEFCGRGFSYESITKHKKHCEKNSTVHNPSKKQRTFDSVSHYTKDTPSETTLSILAVEKPNEAANLFVCPGSRLGKSRKTMLAIQRGQLPKPPTRRATVAALVQKKREDATTNSSNPKASPYSSSTQKKIEIPPIGHVRAKPVPSLTRRSKKEKPGIEKSLIPEEPKKRESPRGIDVLELLFPFKDEEVERMNLKLSKDKENPFNQQTLNQPPLTFEKQAAQLALGFKDAARSVKIAQNEMRKNGLSAEDSGSTQSTILGRAKLIETAGYGEDTEIGIHPMAKEERIAESRPFFVPRFSPEEKPKTRYDNAAEVIATVRSKPSHSVSRWTSLL